MNSVTPGQQQAMERGTPRVAAQLHYIDGALCEGEDARSFQTLSPVTNEPIASVTEGTARDIERAVAAARRAFVEGPWPRMTSGERADLLRSVAAEIRSCADELVELEVLDIGMPVRQMRGQAARAAQNFDYFAALVTELPGVSRQVRDEFLNYTIRKPVGVAGLITPWNSPLMLASWKVAPCLAAGNTCVLKPAEWSPLTATKLAAIFDSVGVPPGVFNVVHGFGETCGAPLVAHPDVRLVSFTGETTTGRAIIANGAATLTRYSFELGGKSPVVVFADCDFDRAVDGVVYQIFTLNGQRCTAGSRLLVEAPLYEDFVQAVAERARALHIGDPFSDDTELGPLIRPEHRDRVLRFIEDADAHGARVLAGGGRPSWDVRGNYLEATVLADVKPSMRVFQDEVFGPVLTATSFADVEEAVRLANATVYGLAGYVWTSDATRAHAVGQAIDAGMVWVNSQNVRDLNMPFGGMKDSGVGREGGHYSFDFFCESQAIHFAMGSHQIPRLGVHG